MRIGIFGATVNDGTIDQVIGEVRDAEAGGFSSYWASQIFGHDALTALALAGREVPRIELGTSVVPTFPRHPMALAEQALTVNAACGGRLCLGIGLSHQVVIESMMGLSFDKPVRHLRDYLSVLMPLLHDGKVSYDGDAYRTRTPRSRSTAPRLPTSSWPPSGRSCSPSPDASPTGRSPGASGPTRFATSRCRRSRPPRRPPAGPNRGSSPRSRSPSPPTRRPLASAPRRRSRSTASCRPTAPCSTGRVSRDRPTWPSSARSSRWPTASPRSRRWVSPTSRPPRSAPRPTSARLTRAVLRQLL